MSSDRTSIYPTRVEIREEKYIKKLYDEKYEMIFIRRGNGETSIGLQEIIERIDKLYFYINFD